MYTYVLLNSAVLASVALLVWRSRAGLPWKQLGIVLCVVAVMTAAFDSLLIYEHVFAYNSLKILGLYIGKAPLEDFAYTIAAVVLIPYLWSRYANKD